MLRFQCVVLLFIGKISKYFDFFFLDFELLDFFVKVKLIVLKRCGRGCLLKKVKKQFEFEFDLDDDNEFKDNF